MSSVAVIGPGAVGTTVAAAVERAGHSELVVCARRPLGAMRLDLASGETIGISAPVAIDPTTLGPAEWVMLAVKSHQVPSSAPWLDRLCSDTTTIVVLQNGVEHEESVAPFAHAALVLPAIVWIDVEAIEPGYVRHVSETRILVPEGDAGRAFAALLEGSFIEVILSDDFVTEAWRKLCLNAITSLQALTGRSSEMFRLPQMQELARRYALECIEVARAEGAGLDVGLADAFVERLATLPHRSRASILLDRLADRQLEWETRNGVVRRAARKHGIATPVSDVVVPLLSAASSEWMDS